MKALILTTSLLLAGSLSGQTIINYDLGGGTNIGGGSGAVGTSVAGVVASDGWQNAAGFPSFSDTTAFYNDGTAATGVELTSDSSGNNSASGASTADGNYTMMNRGLGIAGVGSVNVPPSGSFVEFTGLDTAGVFAAGYNVYVYFTASNLAGSATQTISVTDGTTDFFFLADNTAAAQFDGVFTQTVATTAGDATYADYALFSGLTSSTLRIDLQNSLGSDNEGMLTGIQIVAVPEPSFYAALFAAVALGVVILRRRVKS